MSDSSYLCRKCGGNLWMHTHEQLQTCGVVPDPKGEEIAKLTRERDDAVKRFESVEAFLNATWLTCWAKGVGDLPDRELPSDVEDAARDVSTFILGCKEQISSLLTELAEQRAVGAETSVLRTRVEQLEAELAKVTDERNDLRQDCQDLSGVFEAKFAAAMNGERLDRLDRGVTAEQIEREKNAVARAIERVGPSFQALRDRAEKAEAEVAVLRGVLDRAHADSLERLGLSDDQEVARLRQRIELQQAALEQIAAPGKGGELQTDAQIATYYMKALVHCRKIARDTLDGHAAPYIDRLNKMHRRAQEAERIANLAMSVGYATCWPLRSERDHYLALWKKSIEVLKEIAKPVDMTEALNSSDEVWTSALAERLSKILRLARAAL